MPSAKSETTIDQGEGLGDLISAEEGRHRLEVYAARSKLTTLEAEVLRLEARVAELDQDPNRLPMKLLPEGWTILRLNLYPDSGDWGCILENRNNEPMTVGYSSTPRAAMLAAIERIRK